MTDTASLLTDADIVELSERLCAGKTWDLVYVHLARAVATIQALKARLTPPDATPALDDVDEHGETSESYEEIGRVFMDEYRDALDQPACADFICCDSPSEIISHLLNKYDEALLASRRAPAATSPGPTLAQWQAYFESKKSPSNAIGPLFGVGWNQCIEYVKGDAVYGSLFQSAPAAQPPKVEPQDAQTGGE